MESNLSASQIAQALDGRKAGKDQWKALCPAHADKSPSFSITNKNGKVLFKCWSGCSQGEVIEALTQRGLWSKGAKKAKAGPSVATIRTAQMIVLIAESERRQGIIPSAENRKSTERAVPVVRRYRTDDVEGRLAAVAAKNLYLPIAEARARHDISHCQEVVRRGARLSPANVVSICSAVDKLGAA